MKIKNRLKELRNEEKITLKELSNKTNFSLTQLNRIENHNASFTEEQIIKLAVFFNVSTDYLLGVSDKKIIKNSALIPIVTKVNIDDTLTKFTIDTKKYKMADIDNVEGRFWLVSTMFKFLFLKNRTETTRVYSELLINSNINVNDIRNNDYVYIAYKNEKNEILSRVFQLIRFSDPEKNENDKENMLLMLDIDYEFHQFKLRDINKKWLLVGKVEVIVTFQ